MATNKFRVVLFANGGEFPLAAKPGDGAPALTYTTEATGAIVSTKLQGLKNLGVSVTEANDFGSVDTAWVMRVGILRDVDTSAWGGGDVLWSDVDGVPTNVDPGDQMARIRVGYVLTSGNPGEVFVDCQAIPALGDLSGTEIVDVVQYQLPMWVDGRLINQTFDHGLHPDAASLLDDDHPQYRLRTEGFARIFLLMGG